MPDVTHIRITVFPDSPKARIEQLAEGSFRIYTISPASDGAANKEAMQILRDTLQTDGQIRIVSGHRSPKKIVAITKDH